MIDVFITIVYSIACVGVGLVALRVIGLTATAASAARAPMISGSLILGQALLSAIWLLSGLAGWLKAWLILAVLAASLLGSLRLLVPAGRHIMLQLSAALLWWRHETAGLRILSAGLASLVSAFAIAAWMKPPFGDAEAFYVTYAKIIAATGRIEPMPGLYEPFSSIGMIGEPHLAALIILAGVPAAKLFVWPLALAGASVLVALGRMAGLGNRGSLLLVVMLFTTTAYTHHIWDGKVDLFAAVLGLLAIYWIVAARTMSRPAAGLVLAGLAAGFAVIAKFSYAISLAPAMLVLLLWPGLGVPGLTRMRSVLLVGGAATVATIPHLLKNAALFAAPLAPFVGGAVDQDWLQQVWFAPEVVRQIIATYPLALVFGRYPMQGGNLSFLWLALLPLLWWLPRPPRLRDSLLFQLFVAGLAGALFWMVLRPSIIAPRYLLTVLLLLYPVVARAAEYMLDQETPPRVLGAAICGAALASLAIYSYPVLPVLAESAKQVTGRGSGTCALASPYCPPLQVLNADASPGDRVYTLGYYTYWMREDLLLCKDRGSESRLGRANGDGLTWSRLITGGFRWLVVDRASHGRTYDELMNSARPGDLGLEIRHQVGDILIVRMHYPEASRHRSCRQAAGGTWMPTDQP